MSETDSFIEEVTEEVRRDKLFALMRKYGWIAILAVLLIVGGAAYNEWRKASEAAAAQALGDSLIAALEIEDATARAAALAKITAESEGANAVVALLASAEAQNSGNTERAVSALAKLENNPELAPAYREMAVLKQVLLSGTDMPIAERRSKLETLAVAGAPFRLLAEEQLAMLEIEEGKKDAAISRLQDIINDVEVSAGLRSRASQLIVVLGGKAEAS
ncbi:MAG TPA: hypothetical protein ENK34_12535 [Rhodobacteraceae bacterium]|nr:hypothetical protein [Paracoccaceae bacterium]